MKKIIFLAILMQTCQIIQAMEMPLTPQQKIRAAVVTALKNFDINPNSIDIETQSASYNPPKWECGSSGVLITEDMAIDPSLLTFVSHCAAADIKNRGYYKSISTPIASIGAPAGIGILAACIVPIEYGAPIFLSGLACSLTAWFFARPLDKALSAHFTKQAYAMACKKLIKDEQFKPISVYLAYTHIYDNHKPLTYDQKRESIRKALSDEECFATLRMDKTKQKNLFKSICSIYDSHSLRPLDVSEIVFTDEENLIIKSIQ